MKPQAVIPEKPETGGGGFDAETGLREVAESIGRMLAREHHEIDKQRESGASLDT